MKSLKNKIKKDAKKILTSFLLVSTILWSLGISMLSLYIPKATAAAAVLVSTQGLPTDFPEERISSNSFDMPVLKISVTASQASQTLSAAAVNFSGAGFNAADLQALAVDNTSGTALYNDANNNGMYDPGSDLAITLNLPVWSGNNVTLTPAAPFALPNGTAKVFFVVIKTSGTISNNDLIVATIPANGVVTSEGNGPAANFSANALKADTAPVGIMSVAGSSGSNVLNVRFSKPVKKAGSGFDPLILADTPFVFTDNGAAGGTTISNISHSAGQDFAMITLSDNLDSGDFDATPSALAAGNSKISDMGGVTVGTAPVVVSNPLNITTFSIPSTTVGAVYSAGSPLVAFSAAGGTSPYVWSANSAGDATMLTNLGLSLDANTGKLTGTIADIPGSYSINIKVTDSAVPTLGEWNKFFNINVAPSGGGGVPGISSVMPAGGPKGAVNMPVAITGINSHFSGSSAVQFLLNGANDANITVSGIASNGATNLTFNVTINASSAEGSRDVRITTGTEQVTMPNGFAVFASGGGGLGLLFPGDGAAGIQMPPNFSFNPSVNAAVNSYRISLNTTSNFSGTTLWDYVYPKPIDGQNSNGSHCDSFGCNVGYGEGRFMILTPPAPLAPNTTYYWRVRTYAENPTSSIVSAVSVESTPTRGFTTTNSMSDVMPPNIMHRPIFQAAENANLNVIARVMDNLATASTTPALTTSIYYCAGSSCTPAAGAAPTSLGSGYYKYTIPSAIIGGAGTIVRYYISASDGTNTMEFKQPNGSLFQLISTAAGASNSITGNVKDSNGANLAGAYIFAEGTGFVSAQTGADGNFTLGSNNLFAGTYDLIAIKNGYGDPMIGGVPAGAAGIQFMLGQGFQGGFGGDTSKPMVKFTGPMDGMNGIPGADANFKIFIAFNKPMSQSKFSESGKMLVKRITDFAANPPATANINGSWTYYSSSPNLANLPPEGNMAVFTLGEVLGDNQTIIVEVTSNITDTAGNSIQGNQPNGSYVFSFTTGSTAMFSGGALQGGTFGQGAFMPPHIQGVMPAPGSFDVPTNSKMIINFSDPMAYDSGAYILKNFVKLFTVASGAESEVSSGAIDTVVLDGAKLSAAVNLKDTYNSGRFAASVSYRLKILGGAKSASGMTIAPPGSESNPAFISDFKTGAGADTTAPTVIGSYPNNGDTNVPVNIGAINAAFSKDMNASTISTSTFYLSIGSTAVNGTVEYRGIERQAFFIPKTVLNPNTTYTINITTSAAALNGQSITTAIARTFTTGSADSIAPQISFINVDDYAAAITFSEPMNAAKATDTLNWPASVVNPAVYNLIKYGNAGFNAVGGQGTAISLASVTFKYDSASSTVIIEGLNLPPEAIGKEIYLEMDINGSVPGDANVSKDLSGNKMTSPGNVVRSAIQNSRTTKGALGPMAMGESAFGTGGSFTPTNFSAATFGFAPPIDVKPFNMTAGKTTIYGVRLPVSQQVPAGGAVVLTFPSGFDVSGAKQDINSPMRTDLNGPGGNQPTFKCQTNVTGGKSCSGSANADDTGAAQGGLADDGIVVNTSSRSVTVYLSTATNAEGHDFLTIDIDGIRNSTVPKGFETSGYIVDIKTKNGSTVLESLTSMPFFIQEAGSYALTGTVTAAGNNQSGTMEVYLDSPMTGPMKTTTANFAGGATAAYSFTNLSAGTYMLFTNQIVSIGSSDFNGKAMPEMISLSGNMTYNFALSSASSGTQVTVNITGPANEPLDVFAGSPTGFRVKQITLNGSGSGSASLYLSDGQWFVGVGPQMPKGPMSGHPPAPSYMPPKPKDVKIAGGACTIEGAAGCATAYALTIANKSIRGTVQDGGGKVIANAEVYAYSPEGGFGTHIQADSAGAFTLGVTQGSYIIGAFIPGMPSSKEVPVTVTSHATTYLLIDGASTAITPAAAASSFILKLAKPEYTISGKVTDGTNVVQGASVYAYKTNGPGNTNANTNSSGQYTLYVSSGTWMVGAFLPQYGQLAEVQIIVSSGNVTNQNFSPTQTGTFRTVSGAVTSGGTAVQGAFVKISGNGTSNETKTDVNGLYSFKVPEGNGYVTRAFIPGVGETAPLAAFNVSGADVTGKNIAGGTTRTITFTFSEAVTEAFIDLFGSTGIGNHIKINNASTGVVTLPDGDYKVRVDIPGTVIGLSSIAATSGATVYNSTTGVVNVNSNEGLTINLPTLRTITGTVTDGTSNIANAWVEVVDPVNGIHFGAMTTSAAAPAANFSFKATDGVYFINAMKPGYFREPSQMTVDAGAAAQTLILSSAEKTISGQVLIGSSGAANAFVRAEKQGGGFTGTQADANGNYTLYITSGNWKIYAVAEGYAETAYARNPVDMTSVSSLTGKNVALSAAVNLNAPKSKPITPSSGGTLEDTTSGVKLTIPANALGSSTSAGNIQSKDTNNIRQTGSAKPLMKFDSANNNYAQSAKEIKATDSSGAPITNLDGEITVEMTYTKAELSNTASAADSSIDTKAEADALKMAYWDETTSNWVTKPTTVAYKNSSGSIITDATTIDTASEFSANVSTVVISASTDHFSLYAPVVSTDPSAPSTPSGLSAAAASSSQINLSWTAIGGATGYDIYRSSSSGGTFARLGGEPTVSLGSTTSYSDTGLSAGTSYYYKITALNASGESAASSQVSAATNAAPSGGGGAVSQANLTGSVNINAGAASTNSTSVTLTLNSSGASQMAISNSSDFAGIAWEAYNNTKLWTLSSASGEKKVYAKFKDTAGSTSAIVSDSIVFNIQGSDAEVSIPATPKTETSTPSSSYSEGTLLRYSDSPKVYVVKNGNQVWIQTAEEFKSAGYKWENVKLIAAEVKKQAGSVTLLRAEGDHKVYVIHNNSKRHIPSAEAFKVAGYKWEDIKVINANELGNYSESGAYYADGTLVKSSDSAKVYIISGGKKSWISSAEIFAGAGYKWSDVITAENTELSSYQDAELAPPKVSKVIITNKWLRIRNSNSTKSGILGLAKKGEIYSLLEEKNGWYKIETSKGAFGWVSGQYASKQ